MIIKGLLILSSAALAQVGPSYTGEIKEKPSTTEQRVNDTMVKTNKKMEIESQKKEVELEKSAPKNLKLDPPPKKKTPFIVSPKAPPADPGVYRDQYDHGVGKDPSTEFEQGIIDQRNTPPNNGMSQEEFIRQFKENAAKAGVRVEVDPNTLKAREIKNSNGNH